MLETPSPLTSADGLPHGDPYHVPVLAHAVRDVLGPAKRVLDGTLGGGGHAAMFLDAGADVTGLDRDPDALAAARARLASAERAGGFRAVQTNYANIDEVPALSGATFDAILLDLGVSSHQLDADDRGFTFRPGAPLDARMAGEAGERTAADWLNDEAPERLQQVLKDYGDEPKARRIAAEIVRRRATRPFATSDDFVGAIRSVLGPRSGAADFARLFQALRIAVNDELAGLERALPALRNRLTPGGIIAVIAYHSGEDRVVKHAFREWSRDCVCPPRAPFCTCGHVAEGTLLTRKSIVATSDEAAANPRARSARLRAWQRSA